MNDRISETELQPTVSIHSQRQQAPATRVGTNGTETEGEREREISGLGAVDRGRDAWRVLLAAFIFEALFWGESARFFLLFPFLNINCH